MRELKVSVYVGVLLVLYVKHTHLCKFKCLEKPDVVNIKCYIYILYGVLPVKTDMI